MTPGFSFYFLTFMLETAQQKKTFALQNIPHKIHSEDLGIAIKQILAK